MRGESLQDALSNLRKQQVLGELMMILPEFSSEALEVLAEKLREGVENRETEPVLRFVGTKGRRKRK